MKTVLIVDDSPTLRGIARNALSSIPVRILEAENPQIGFAILKREAVDMILLDWYMPQMTGLEMLVHLKKTESLKDIPVVMVTVASEKSHMLDAIRAGAKHYLTKPFTNEDLLSRVVQVLKLDIEESFE